MMILFAEIVEPNPIQSVYWLFTIGVLIFTAFNSFQTARTQAATSSLRAELAAIEMRLTEKFSEKMDIKLEKQRSELEKNLEKYALKDNLQHLERRVEEAERKLYGK